MKREVDHGPYWFTIYLELVNSVPRILPAFLPAVLIGLVAGVPLLLLNAAGVVGASAGESLFDQLVVLVIVLAVVIAFAPVAMSLLTLFLLPGGYKMTRWELDAEEPSARQHDLLVDSQRRVTANAPAGSIGPSKWLVLDKNDPNAFVIGTTIYVHRGLITSDHLDPVIAHELGHLNHGDGRLALALRRLTPPPISLVTFDQMGCLPLLVMVFNGGLGLLLTGWLWNRHWQKRELLADRFAFACGQATGLIEYLELYQFFDVAVPFGSIMRGHPHHEQRIDELMRMIRTEAEKAELEARLRVLEAELKEDEAVEQRRAQEILELEAELREIATEEERCKRRIQEHMARRQALKLKRGEPEAEPGAKEQGRPPEILELEEYERELDREIAALKLELLKSEAARAGRQGDVTDEKAVLSVEIPDEARVGWETTTDPVVAEKGQAPKYRRGFTDAASMLDLVFLDEDHVGSADPEQIAAEKDWIRSNGRRIVDLAHLGTSTSGPCAIWIFWMPRSEEQYGNDAFHYITREAHSELIDDSGSRIAGPIPPALAAKWRRLVATHDASREVVVVILSLQWPSGRFNLHQYLAGMQGGGPLPAWGEEPPS